MIVTCAPLYDGDTRPVCGRRYDDARKWTICPHPPLDMPAPTVEAQRADAIAHGWTPPPES